MLSIGLTNPWESIIDQVKKTVDIPRLSEENLGVLSMPSSGLDGSDVVISRLYILIIRYL